MSNPAYLTRDTEIDLIAKAQSGDLASRDRLVASLIHWVWKLAKKQRAARIEVEDLVQVGMIGLLRAIQQYSPALGTRLVSFATPVIIRQMQHVAQEQGVVRVPVNAHRGSPSVRKSARRAQYAGSINVKDSHDLEWSEKVRAIEPAADVIVSVSEAFQVERAKAMAAIKKLPSDWPDIVGEQLDGMTITESAEKHGVSKQRIAQKRRKALLRLQEMCTMRAF